MAPDWDALDVANKIKIIETEFSWLILNIKFLPLKQNTKTRPSGGLEVRCGSLRLAGESGGARS